MVNTAIDIKKVGSMISGKLIMFIVIGMVSLIFIIYISKQINLLKDNCKIISNYKPTLSVTLNGLSAFNTQPISNLFIKTAYNCCCTGHFRNDYVDDFSSKNNCALKNCALQGVRALDFTVYSIGFPPAPIISASSVVENQYKEMYNYSNFAATMIAVKEYFLSGNDITNTSDPLFLIFRIFSNDKTIYDQIGTLLNSTFNNIYTSSLTPSTLISALINKVVIIVEPFTDKTNVYTPLDNFVIHSTPLKTITSLILDPAELNPSCINRLSYISNSITTDVKTHIILLYPDLYTWSNANYDSSTYGFPNAIPFIAMNFQNQDKNLVNYMSYFNVQDGLSTGSFRLQKPS